MINQLTAGLPTWTNDSLASNATGTVAISEGVNNVSVVETNTADNAPVVVVSELTPHQQTIQQLIGEISRVYHADTNLARAIAGCESRWSQFGTSGKVLRGRKNPSDVGVFQINENYHLAPSRKLGFDIHTIEGNIAYAMWLLQRDGAKPWRASQTCWSREIAKI